MVQATQGGTVANLKAGPCSLVFKGVTLGFTQDGQEVSEEPTWADIVVDQFGSTPIDAILESQIVTCTTILSEFTLTNLQLVLGGAIKVVDGAKEYVSIGRSAGYRARSDAGVLTLHPIVNAVADVTEDVTFHKAYVNDAVAFAFIHNGVRSYSVVWRCLIDEAKSEGNHLFSIGDPTALADVTPPSVASITPVDGAAAQAVGVNVEIILVADDLRESSMVANAVMLIDDSNDAIIPAALSWASASKKITLNPTSDLSAATKHRVVVTGLVDTNGNVQTAIFSSDFTTA